ncbi:MAG: glycosyltransferase [Clostridia bacterium]|nr:glycosyltransferase [Clostridia bacterium]
MPTFEILCATMHQTDFSKINEMNIRSNVVFANQADNTAYDEYEFDGHKAKMITTDTRGVGINRNLALMYASADICLFADDDVVYFDDMEQKVLAEFEAHPDADIMIFYFESDSKERVPRKYAKTKRCGRFSKMSWGAVRIAFRLESVIKANVWFTTLFGGGCLFPSGEDSMWLNDAKKRGLTFYVSKETIGKVSYATSTWFTGYDEKLFYGKGVYYKATRPKTVYFWLIYIFFVYMRVKGISMSKRIRWMIRGIDGYKKMMSYDDYCEYIKKENK